MLKQFNIPEPNKPEINSEENIPKISHKQTYPIDANSSIVNILSSVLEPEKSELKIETFKGHKLKQAVKESALKSEIIPLVQEDYPTTRDIPNSQANSQDTSSLMIPVISLSLVLIIVTGLGFIRGFYSRYVNPNPGPSRSRSRTGTIESKRSSGSKRSEETVYSSSRKMRRKERELELERERILIYEEFRHKPSLSPLIAVIKLTPPLHRKSPIFLMTHLKMP